MNSLGEILRQQIDDMKFLHIATTLFLLVTPATAGQVETTQLLDLIESTGTTVSFNTNTFDESCVGKAGYYSFEADVEDLFVVCSDNVDTDDPDALWEAVAHEATHVMQACLGGLVFDQEYLPRTFREIERKAPHYAKLLDDKYTGKDTALEAEAFWMELQPPAEVINYFNQACFSQE